MSKEIYAVITDVISIQKYIFASNELKDNLGASYLVDKVYQDFLAYSYKEVTGVSVDPENWEKYPDNIGYIGGGNALIFFETENQAQNFIKDWTKNLLINIPGCTPITAYSKFDLDNFNKSINQLFEKLRNNKSEYITQTVIPRHGITSECNRTGLSAECWNDKVGEGVGSYISMVSKAKINVSKQAKTRYDNFLPDGNYSFPDELGKLGQKEQEKNHVAVVHIDGNNIGKEFRESKSLENTRKLSKDIRKITEDSFEDLVKEIKKEIEKLSEEFSLENNILPIRPIIIGGDDITFVCPGKLGIYFAKLFLEFFENNSQKIGYTFTACAGVSIVKSKYPFFKAYQISEELCKNAKKYKKERDKKGSWIDFNINSGTILSDLEELRKNHFMVKSGNLLFRPYLINDKDSEATYSHKSFNTFVENTINLKKEFPASKIKELREILTLGEDSIKTFINQQEARGNNLPKIQSMNYTNNGFQEKETPYFDMIELMEFYPKYVLENK